MRAAVQALRHDLRAAEALALLQATYPTGIPEDLAPLVAKVTLEADLLGRLGPPPAVQALSLDEVIRRLRDSGMGAAEELVLADLCFLLERPQAGEDALGRARDSDPSLKETTDRLLGQARGVSVPPGGWHRYRGLWLSLEEREQERACDQALERLHEALPGELALGFMPSPATPNRLLFEQRWGAEGEKHLRRLCADLRGLLQSDYAEVRGWVPSYYRASDRRRLLAIWEEMEEPRKKALELIGRYEKPDQPEVDAFRQQLEKTYARFQAAASRDQRRLERGDQATAYELLARIRTREEALAAVDRFLALSTGGGLPPVSVAPLPTAEVTPRHFLPGRQQSELEDVLWIALHQAAGQTLEVMQRTEELLFKANQLTGWEVLLLRGLQADAVERFNGEAATSIDAEERRFVRTLNSYRQVLGLAPLEIEERLIAAARKHSQEMIDLGYFGHISPVARNRTPSDRVRLEGYAGGVGENCLAGQVDGPGAFEGWYNSPGHHRLLVSRAPHVGIGAAAGHRMWTMVAGGRDLSWRLLHQDLPPTERPPLETLALRMVEEAGGGSLSDAVRAEAAPLLPVLLPLLARRAFSAALESTRDSELTAAVLLGEIARAQVPVAWRPLQVAAVAAAIELMDAARTEEARAIAFHLVGPLIGPDSDYEPAAPRRRRQPAVLDLRRQWEDEAQWHFRPEGQPVVPSRPIPPGRIGDGPALGAPLRVLTPPERLRLAARGGGSRSTEEAVERGLLWLTRVQDEDGGWRGRSFATKIPRTRGLRPTDIGLGNAEWEVALTGLSLLAFASAGHTTHQGEHAGAVERGARFLLERITDYGMFETTSSHYMYSHALATQALCELYAYSAEPRLGLAAQLCLDYLAYAQHPASGGWRYRADERGDTSVTGWVVMALNSASKAGLDVAGYRGALRFLDEVTWPGYYQIGYTGRSDGGHLRLGAVGTLMRLFLTGDREDPRVVLNALRLLAALPARGREDFYCWYYATLSLFQLGGERWKRWNEALVPTLLQGQVDDPTSPLTGSWKPDGHYGGVGGRIYQTALGVLMLTTYYRYDRSLVPRVTAFTGVLENKVTPYLEILRDGTDEVASAVTARKLVDRFGSALAPELLRWLRREGETGAFRRRLAELLAECVSRDDEAALLEQVALETDDRVMELLLQSLERASSSRSRPLLEQHLDHPNSRVRGYAARALGRIGDPAAVAALSRRLQQEEDGWCQAVLREALARLAGRRATLLLLDDSLAGEDQGRLRLLDALELLEQNGMADRLVGTRSREPALYRRLTEALRQHREGALVPLLMVVLESEDEDTRTEALKGLRALTGNDHGFDPRAEPAARRAALDRWHKWWEESHQLYGEDSSRL